MKSTNTSHLKRALCMVMAVLLTFGVFFNAAFVVNAADERKGTPAHSSPYWDYYDDGEIIFTGEIKAIGENEIPWTNGDLEDISGNIKSITIANNVKKINANGFRFLRVGAVGIPKTVDQISPSAFEGSSITKVYYEGTETEWKTATGTTSTGTAIAGVTVYFNHKHSGGVLKHGEAATCIKEGYEGDKYCSLCGSFYANGQKIDKTGHVWSSERKIILEETCCKDGKEAYYCLNCGIFDYSNASLRVRPADPNKHNWVVYEADKLDNCVSAFTENSETQYIVMHCDNEGCGAVSTDDVFNDFTYKKQIEENGKKKIVDFTINGNPVVEKVDQNMPVFNSLSKAQQKQIVNKEAVEYNIYLKFLTAITGEHHYTYEVRFKDENGSCICTDDREQVATCEWCKAFNTEPEITDIPAKGHSDVTTGDVIEYTIPATCDKKGERGTRCTVCNEILSKEDIPTRHTKGHYSGSWVTVKEPTCVNDGTQRLRCNYCGLAIKDEEGHYVEKKLDKTPTVHATSRWFTTLEPTCTVDGEQIQVCTNEGCPYYSDTEIGQEAVKISDRKALDILQNVTKDTNRDHYYYENDPSIAADDRVYDVADEVNQKILAAYKSGDSSTLDDDLTTIFETAVTHYGRWTVNEDEKRDFDFYDADDQKIKNYDEFGAVDIIYGMNSSKTAVSIVDEDIESEEFLCGVFEGSGNSEEFRAEYRFTFSKIVEEAVRLLIAKESVINTTEEVVAILEAAWYNLGTEEMADVVAAHPELISKVTNKALHKDNLDPLGHDFVRVPYILVSNEFIPVCRLVQKDDEGNIVVLTDENGDPIPLLDENGVPVLDEDGNPVYEYAYEEDGWYRIRSFDALGFPRADIDQNGEPVEPELIPGEAVTEVNCNKGDGNIITICTRCLELGEPKLVKQGSHDLKTKHIAPTCYKDGYDHTYCTKCDYYVDVETNIKYNHKNADGSSAYEYVTIKESTCSKAGIKVKICKFCGDVDKSTYQTLATLPHHDDPVSEAATCTKNGRDGVVCSVCGRFEGTITPALEHDYQETVVPPTCTELGYTVAKCSRCGDTKAPEKFVAVAGHQYGKAVNMAATCEHGSYTYEECKVCGYKKIYDEKDNALGHSMSVISAVAPTCTEYGRTEKIYCSRPGCGYVQKESKTLPALGHTPGAEPTCTKAQTCIRCSYVFKPAKGHTPNRTKAGCEEDKVCTTCGMILDLHTGHSYGDWQIKKEATPFRKGIKARTCANCGGVEQEEYRLTLFQSIRWIFTHFLDIILALLGRANGVFN